MGFDSNYVCPYKLSKGIHKMKVCVEMLLRSASWYLCSIKK